MSPTEPQRRRGWIPACLALIAGCGFTPLSNQIEVGEEAFVVVVASAADQSIDLFAAPAEGGTFRQLTFTRVEEDAPRLAESGTRLAFARYSDAGTDRATVTVLDLKLGTESAEPLPEGAGRVRTIGWFAGDDSLAVVAAGGSWASSSRGSLAWAPLDPARADSLTIERVGRDRFGVIASCPDAAVCIVTEMGATPLDAEVTAPIRWGPEAIGYLRNGEIEVRPLSGGRVDHPKYRSIPPGIRSMTHHPGAK